MIRIVILTLILQFSAGGLSGCVDVQKVRNDKSEFHYKLANNFFYDKNIPSAIKELYEVLKHNPRHAHAHHLLGFIYFGRKDYVRALKHLQMSVTINPDYHEALNLLGSLYLALERWQDAIPYFEQLLNIPLYRTPYLAQNNLGWALYNLGRYKEAQRYLELSIFYKPKFCKGYNNLGRLHATTGATKLAIENFHKAVKYCPSYVEPIYFLGRIYAALSVTDKARAFFKRCYELKPESSFGRKCGEAL
jgi:type IV pilus assembly protein PilF